MEILNDFDKMRLILECSHPQKQNFFPYISCNSDYARRIIVVTLISRIINIQVGIRHREGSS